jgi:hypothetical protein
MCVPPTVPTFAIGVAGTPVLILRCEPAARGKRWSNASRASLEGRTTRLSAHRAKNLETLLLGQLAHVLECRAEHRLIGQLPVRHEEQLPAGLQRL